MGIVTPDRSRRIGNMTTRHNLSQIVADMWDEMLRENENPLTDSQGLMNALLGFPPMLWRDYLVRVQYNHYGNPIPRIVIVRRNLRRLGNIRLDPSRLV